MESVLFGDVVALVIDWLNPRVTPPVMHTIPNPRPSTFVTVLRTGGVRETVVSEGAQITVEAWADRSEDAHDLAQLCRAHIHAMAREVIGGVQVYRIEEFSGPGDLPDPVSQQPRYTFTVSMSVRYASIVPA